MFVYSLDLREYLCYTNNGATNNGRRLAPNFGGNFFAPEPQTERGGVQMVTYSDLIQIGILIVGIIGLFLQTKKK